jgi:chaperonin GroES
MFQPLHDVIWLKPIEEEKSPGGVILTRQKDGARKGKVVYVGTGSEKHPKPTTVKEGDTVAYLSGMVQEYRFQGEDYLVAHEKDLLGVYDD